MMRTLLLLLLPAVAACSGGAHRSSEPSERPATARQQFSVYDVGGAWRDQSGTALALPALRGKPRVIAMVYTHCTATCPIALANMKRIESETGPNVGLVLVSLDPERDTPGALAMYAREKELSTERWTLLNGSDGDVRALAAVIGVRYRRVAPETLAHSNMLTVVDANGAVVHQQQGFDETAATIRIAQSLAASATRADR